MVLHPREAIHLFAVPAFLDPSACVGHYSEPFISLLNVCNNPREKHYYYYFLYFIDNELEAQRVEATCPGSHNGQVGFTSLKYIALDRSLNPFEPWVSCFFFLFCFSNGRLRMLISREVSPAVVPLPVM